MDVTNSACRRGKATNQITRSVDETELGEVRSYSYIKLMFEK